MDEVIQGARYTQQELLASVMMRLAVDAESIAVGNTSPIPAAAALAVFAKRKGQVTLFILGSFKYNKLFTGGIREQYDFSAKGRVDVQFFGGGQIDGRGNIVKSQPWQTAGAIDAVLPPAANSPTPFARLGNIIPLTLGFLLIIGGIVMGRRRR